MLTYGAALAAALTTLPLAAPARADDKPAIGSAAGAPAASPQHRTTYRVRASFDEVWDFVQVAVTDRGIQINNVSHIGAMLERTARDVGADRGVFGKARAIEFCSAVLSRRMMEADPHNIVFCPYIIAVYEVPSEPGIVYVSYRRPTPVGSPASRQALAEVEALLDGIAREAAGK